jgi:hypothetical protein
MAGGRKQGNRVFHFTFGINLAGKVPLQFHTMELSATIDGSSVMVPPSMEGSIFVTVTEMRPVTGSTEAELILVRAESPTPKLV